MAIEQLCTKFLPCHVTDSEIQLWIEMEEELARHASGFERILDPIIKATGMMKGAYGRYSRFISHLAAASFILWLFHCVYLFLFISWSCRRCLTWFMQDDVQSRMARGRGRRRHRMAGGFICQSLYYCC